MQTVKKIRHNAAFQHSLYCLIIQNPSPEEKIQYFLEIISCDPSVEPSIYRMDHPDFIACSFIEKSIGLKRLNAPDLEKSYLCCI